MRRLVQPTRAAAVAAGVLLAVTACGGEVPEPGTSASAQPDASQVTGEPDLSPGEQSPAPNSTADGVTGVQALAVEISGGQVVGGPQFVEAEVGVPVAIEVTSDVATEVHVHGPDETRQVSPGEPTIVEVTFDAPGVYDVEAHVADDLLLAQVSIP